MVSFLKILFLSMTASASLNLQQSPTSMDPAYLQAVGKRLVNWVVSDLAERGDLSAPEEKMLIKLTSDLKEWTFQPVPERNWGRVQFSVRLRNSQSAGVTLSVFPDQPGALAFALKDLPQKPEGVRLQVDELIGVGMQWPERWLVLYRRQGQSIEARSYQAGRLQKTEIYEAATEPAPQSSFPLHTMATNWATWKRDGKLVKEEMSFNNLNLRWIDQTLNEVVYRVSREFLLNPLRLRWSGPGDYEIVYP